MNPESVKTRIRTVRGWPIPAVNFRDISTLFEDGNCFHEVIQSFREQVEKHHINRIVGIDARGFVLAGGLAACTGLPLVMVRKKGKLPPPTIEASYSLEYGEATMELRDDSCSPGDRVMILDDLIATGGTLGAAASLVRQLGGIPVLIAAVIDLPELGGSAKLEAQGYRVFSLCSFNEDE
jgi:adenine phosphoribosyltransferase